MDKDRTVGRVHICRTLEGTETRSTSSLCRSLFLTANVMGLVNNPLVKLALGIIPIDGNEPNGT